MCIPSMKRTLKHGVCGIFALSLLVWATSAVAATWYVNGATGNDLNNGSNSTTPVETITAAGARAASGDVIKVASAIEYTGNIQFVGLNGLTIEGGWNADFSARDTTDGKTLLRGTGEGYAFEFTNCLNCDVSGFDIANYRSAIRTIHNRKDQVAIYIHQNNIHDCLSYGLYSGGCYVVIEDNVIFNNKSSAIAAHGPYNTYETCRADILGNFIANNGGGLYLIGRSPFLIANNILVHNGGYVSAVHVAYPGMYALVLNNTIMYNSTGGLSSGAYGYISARNNIIAFNNGYGFNNFQNNWWYNDYNLVFGNELGDYLNITPGAHNINLDPALDDTYHLLTGSPCVDAGADVSYYITIDYDGDERNTSLDNFDIGADEYILSRFVNDVDGDGYTGDIDCNDNDASINPGAYEIFNNGIDENCNGMADDADASVMVTGTTDTIQQLPVEALLTSTSANSTSGTTVAENRIGALQNMITAVSDTLSTVNETMTDSEKMAVYNDCLIDLNAILAKTDGFYGGNPKNDWVTTQEGQDLLYPQVQSAMNFVQGEISKLSSL